MSYKTKSITKTNIPKNANNITLLSSNNIVSGGINVSFKIKGVEKTLHFLISEVSSFELQNNTIFLYTSDGSLYLINFLTHQDALLANDRINKLLNGGFF